MADDKDLEFEDDFDDYGFGADDDFGTQPVPDNRKPATKIATSFIQGVGDEFTNPTTVKRLTLEALPEGYAKADKMLGDVVGVGRDLYNTTVTELKPVIRDAKRVARRVLPSVKSFLPDKLAKKLEQFTADDEARGLTPEQSRELAVQSDVANIFSAVAEQDAENRVTDEVERTRSKVEDRKKFKLEIEALSSIHGALSRLVTYQDQVTAKYQRKSLELSYLQYYTLKDTFELHRAATREQKSQLDLIVKNTGLPEYQKTTLGEAAGEQFRNKLIEATTSRVKKAASEYFGAYGENIKKSIKGQLGDFKEGALGALSGIDMAVDINEQMEDMGESTDLATSGGRLAGSSIGGMLGKKAVGFLRPILDRIPGLREGAARAEYTADNLSGVVDDFAKSDTGENTKFEWFNRAVRGLKDLAPNEIDDPYIDAKRETDLIKANDAVAFSHAARKSLTDIIPGFLSRIHHELAIIRTGDDTISRIDYDLQDGSFRDTKTITRNLMGSLFSKENLEKTNASTEELIDNLTGGDASKLSPEARKALKSKMIAEASKLSGSYSSKKLYDVDNWDDQGLSDEDRIALSDLFLESKDDIVLQNQQSKKFHAIREHLNNPAEAIKALSMQAGGLEYMRQAGLVIGENQDRRVNTDRITEMLTQGGYNDRVDQTTSDSGITNRLFGPVGVGGGSSVSTNDSVGYGGGGVPRSPSEIKSSIDECVCGDEFDRLIEAVREGNDKLVTEITKSHTENAQQAEQIALLAGIYEHIQSGEMMVYSIDGTGMFKSMRNRVSKGYQGLKKRLGGLANNRLTKGIGSALSSVKNMATSIVSQPGKLLTNTKTLLSKGWNKVTSKFNEVKELYVKGELHAKLTKAKLDAKEYYDAETGKLIEKWEDITGPIKDRAGEYVLTAEEWAKGLWDDRGKPWKAKLKAKAKGLWGTAVGLVTKPFNVLSNLKQGMKAFGKSIKDALNKPRDIYIPGREEPIILASIMQAGGYKNSDGSIIRVWTDIKGSVYDLEGNVVVTLEQLKQGMMDSAGKKLQLARGFLGTIVDGVKNLAGKAVSGVKKIGKSFGKLLKGGVKGIGDKLKGKFNLGGGSEMLEVIGEYQILLLEEIRDATRALKPKTVKGDLSGDGLRDNSWDAIQAKRKADRDALAESKKKDKPGKKKKGFSLMSLLASAVTMLGAIPTALAGGFGKIGALLGGTKLATAAIGAGKLALGVGKLALGAGKLAVFGGAALAKGVMAVGGSLLGALSAPVVLGAAAIAAVGFGAWWLYKRRTRNQRGGLLKLRMAQYGFDIKDHDNVDKLLAFEDLVSPAVKVKGGDPYIDFKSVDVDKLKKVFNIKDDDPESFDRFAKWCDARFSPVYLSHDAATKKLSTSGKMEEVDKELTPEDKLKYLEIVRLPDDKAYNALDHPMREGRLEVDVETINSIFATLKAEYQTATDKDKTKEKEKTGSKAVDEAKAAVEEKGILAKAFGGSLSLAATVLKYSPIGIAVSLAKATADKLTGLGKTLFSWIKGKFFADDFKVPTILNREIDPFTSIRYRLYGLTIMEYSKALPISKLEEHLIKDISYSGKGQARWDGDTKDLFKQVGGLFLTNTEDEEIMKRWSEWFTKRFLPVFLSYLSAVRGFLKNGNPFEAYESLAAPQALEVARFTANAVSNADDKPEKHISVWSIAESPFDQHENNTDPETIVPFILMLEDAARVAILTEKRNTNKGTDGAPTDAQTTTPSTTRVSNSVSAAAAGMSGGGGGKTYTTPFEQAMFGGMDRSTEVGITGGGSTALSMEAAGGAWQDLPGSPGPEGKYETYKEMILGVSKMTGVDPGMLATIAGVESTFRGQSAAKGSTAKGLYQFVDDTWADVLKNHGKKYGIPANANVFDPRANALMGAEYLKENMAMFKRTMNKEATDTELYMAHFMGPTGVRKFLKAGPDEIAASVLPSGAKSNPDIFYDKQGKARTVAQTYADIEKRISVWRGTVGNDARKSLGMGEMATAPTTSVVPGITSPSSMGGGESAPSMSEALMTTSTSSAGGGGAGGSVGVMAGTPALPAASASVATTSFQQGTKPTNPTTTASQAKGMGQAMLQREASQDDGTYGVLTLPDGSTFHTLELPWNDNITQKSCIPPGTYKVEIRDSPKFGRCYEVKQVPGRSAILIHAGNTAGNVDKGLKSDVQGCILLGLSRGRINNQIAVTESKPALAAFMQKMGGQSFVMNVVGNAQDTAAQALLENEAVVTPESSFLKPSDLTPPEPANSPLVKSLIGSSTAPLSGALPMTPLNSAMDLPSFNTAPSPADFTPEAIVQRQQALQQQAANVQVQSVEVSKQTQENTVSVELLMNQQLQVQMSMDASLKNIDAGINNLAQTLGSTGTGDTSKPNTTNTPVKTPTRAKATPASLTPVKFNRRVSY